MTTLSPSQLRAARALLNWSRAELAERSGISKPTLHRFENGTNEPEIRTTEKLLNVFNDHGIIFTENDGVRRHHQDIEVYIGVDRFQEFTEFVYQYLVKYGGDVCISVVDETQFQKYRRDVARYRERMTELVKRGDITVRILASESTFIPLFTQMKWQPRQGSTLTSFYAFGNCLALISFDHDPAPYVALHKSGPFAEAYRQAFNVAWRHAKPPPKTEKR